jgi:DNA topoisomerase I
MRRIWVIEAPGKKSAFQSALKDAGFSGDQVLATYGRLYDLPSDTLGFDPSIISQPDTQSEILWEPKRRNQVKQLIELLGKGTEVILATDSDLEGELIASQVQGLCQLAEKDSGCPLVVSRVVIKSITSDAMRQAYQQRRPVDSNKVRAAKARRVLDRLLGYRLHDPEDPWKLSIGRVVTPLVHSLLEDPAESVVIRKRLESGWSAIVRLNSRQADQADQVVGLLHALPSPSLESVSSERQTFECKPLTGPEALRLCMRTLSDTPGSIQQAIQSNYEKGRLSYPRTDSRTLGEVGLKWISRMASREAIEYDDNLARSRQAEQLERAYDAHEALIPTDDNLPHSSVPLRYLALEEAILRVIGDHSLRIGERAEQFTRESASLDAKCPVSRKWSQVLSTWHNQLTFIRDVDASGFEHDPLRHELIRVANVQQGSVSCWKHPAVQIAMERLIKIGLGRPSTLLGLSEKTLSNYLDQHGQVNGRGRIMLEKVMRRLPELLNHEIAQSIEQAVSDLEREASIGTRLAKAWDILKKNPVLLGTVDPFRTMPSGSVAPGDGGSLKKSDPASQYMPFYFDGN